MSEVKMKTILMLSAAKGAPEGHTVVEYAKDWTGEVRKELAELFIRDGLAEEVAPEGEAIVLIPAWPPTDEQIAALSFSGLGVLLEQKGVALGPLKSEDARRVALREIIAADKPAAPWPETDTTGKITDEMLARHLTAKGVDLSTITTRETAETKLRELLGIESDWPLDSDIDAMTSASIQSLLQGRSIAVDGALSDEDARAKLREIIAAGQ